MQSKKDNEDAILKKQNKDREHMRKIHEQMLHERIGKAGPNVSYLTRKNQQAGKG